MTRPTRPAERPARQPDGVGEERQDLAGSGEAGGRIRIDRWLCHARVFRTRSLAAAQVVAGGVRVNGNACLKPAQPVAPGDIVTVAAHGQVQVLKVLAPGIRRGPPAEAQLLYDRLDGLNCADGGSPTSAAP